MILDPNGQGFLGGGGRNPAVARLVLDAYQIMAGPGRDVKGKPGVTFQIDVAGWPVRLEFFMPAENWQRLVDSISASIESV